MKTLQFILLLSFFGVLTAALVTVPPRGDITAPAQQITNPMDTPVAGAYYIQYAYKDAKTPNMVTVILADYRAFDTLGEVIVVFTGGLACFFILNIRRRLP